MIKNIRRIKVITVIKNMMSSEMKSIAIMIVLISAMISARCSDKSDRITPPAGGSALFNGIIASNPSQYSDSTASVLSLADENKFTADGMKWFKGDFHCHSDKSDGDTSVAGVIFIAEQRGLDFLAITDHNTQAQWSDSGFTSDKLSLIYATEWTTAGGHGNILSSSPYDWDTALSVTLGDSDLAIQIVHGLRNPGSEILFTINHPGYPYGNSWTYGFSDSMQADCVEIWNGHSTSPEINFLNMVSFADNFLSSGFRISVRGGSDSHLHSAASDREIGGPTTWVRAVSGSSVDILNGLRDGRAFISADPMGARTYLYAIDSGVMTCMGGTIPGYMLGTNITFRAEIYNAGKASINECPYRMAVVSKNGLLFHYTLNSGDNFTIEFTDAPAAGDYYMASLISIPGDVTEYNLMDIVRASKVKTITNPLYTW
jgi:hypothetical protein